jgi:hypothetical protein
MKKQKENQKKSGIDVRCYNATFGDCTVYADWNDTTNAKDDSCWYEL